MMMMMMMMMMMIKRRHRLKRESYHATYLETEKDLHLYIV
jgi:hypothetical protein